MFLKSSVSLKQEIKYMIFIDFHRILYTVEQKYQALLDSKSNSTNVAIANEYIGRVLLELRRYAKNVLYSLSGDEWARRMFHVIENNLLRLTFRYKESESSMPYILDTTLDSKDEFINIIKYEKPYDEIEYIVNNVVETD